MPGIINHPDSRHVILYRRRESGFARPMHVVRGAVESTLLPGLAIPLDGIFADCE